MDACDTLTAIAADPELRRAARLPHRAARPARPAPRRSPDPLHPEVDGAPRQPAGIDELWTHQAAAIDAAARRAATSWSRPAPRPGSRSATSCRSSTSVVRGEPDTALLMFPTKALAQDQLRSLRSWLVPGPARRHLRRRHAARRPRVGPQERERRAHEPRDAAPGDPPVPPALGDLPDAAAARRGRRAALAARDLRQQRRARAAAAAAGVRALRVEPVVLLRERDDRQPGRARARRCAGTPVHRDRRRRLAAGRALLRRSGNGRCSTRTPGARVGQRRDRRAARPLRARRPADARVHPQPARRRARRRRRPGAGCEPDTRMLAEPRRRVPRRLPARGAPRARDASSATARCSASRPRTRSSSASTSAGSTRSCSTASPARSRRCASRRAAPGAPAGGPRRCSSPATTSSTSGTPRIPTELFGRTPEAAVVNPTNPFVLRPQVACAAHELPLEPSDEAWFGPGLDDAVRELVLDEQLKPRDGRMYWAGREPPAPRVGLRTGSSVEFRLVGRDDDGDDRLIGTVDSSRGLPRRASGRALPAPGPAVAGRPARPRRPRRVARAGRRRRRVHPGPRGHRHRDHRRGRAGAVRCRVGAPRRGRRHEPRSSPTSASGRRPNATIEVVPLDLPPRTLPTRACWYTIPWRRAGRGRASSRTRCSARCTRPSTR